MLNMGQPVKIVDWQDLIRLRIARDTDIRFTGCDLEKIVRRTVDFRRAYEPTEHVKILIVRNASGIVPENLELIVKELSEAARKMMPIYRVFCLKASIRIHT